eukprot:7379043-Prymnesium_polylepis.1
MILGSFSGGVPRVALAEDLEGGRTDAERHVPKQAVGHVRALDGIPPITWAIEEREHHLFKGRGHACVVLQRDLPREIAAQHRDGSGLLVGARSVEDRV